MAGLTSPALKSSKEVAQSDDLVDFNDDLVDFDNHFGDVRVGGTCIVNIVG
jgi:hypothetical protein